MAKRAATTDLNHENWDKEEEPEEPGVFQPANADVLAGRVIKTAKRRFKNDSDSGTKSRPFSGFTGFGSATSTSTSSPFSFLTQNKSKPSDGDKNGVKGNGVDSKDSQTQFKSFSFSPGLSKDDGTAKTTTDTLKPFEHIFKPKPSENDMSKKSTNLESLKELNLSCSSWIKEHLEKNPYCILTPIFKDYEKHLAELKLNLNSEDKEVTILSEKDSLNKAEDAKVSSKEESSEPAKVEKDKSTEFKIENPPAQKPFTFQFGNSTAFGGSNTTFSLNQIASKPAVGDSEAKNDEDDAEEPPKNDFVPVVEDDSIYDVKCKVFVKKEGSFVSRGVGTLFLKPVKDSTKTQLVVRAHTNLGNILLNVLLSPGMPIQKNGNNNAMLVCIPTPDTKPPPVPVLIRVKTSEECDELIKKLEECRGS